MFCPLMSPTLSQRGARKIATIASASATAVTAARAVASLDTAQYRLSEEPGRADEQHGEDQQECHRQPHTVELDVQVLVVRRDQVQRDADREAADDGADRALEPADDGGGEGV